MLLWAEPQRSDFRLNCPFKDKQELWGPLSSLHLSCHLFILHEVENRPGWVEVRLGGFRTDCDANNSCQSVTLPRQQCRPRGTCLPPNAPAETTNKQTERGGVHVLPPAGSPLHCSHLLLPVGSLPPPAGSPLHCSPLPPPAGSPLQCCHLQALGSSSRLLLLLFCVFKILNWSVFKHYWNNLNVFKERWLSVSIIFTGFLIWN